MHPSVGWQAFKLKVPLTIPLYWKMLIHMVFFGLIDLFFLDGRNFTPKVEYIIKFISVYIPWIMLLPSWFHWYAILVQQY